MRIMQAGNTLTATHVSGPTHNLLEFVLMDGAAELPGGPIFVFDEPREEWPIDDVKRAILAGISEGGAPGTMRLRSVRFLGSDTPRTEVYRMLASRLTRHANEQTIHRLEAAG